MEQAFKQTQWFEPYTALSLLACDLKGSTWSSTDGSERSLIIGSQSQMWEDKLRKEMSVLPSGQSSYPVKEGAWPSNRVLRSGNIDLCVAIKWCWDGHPSFHLFQRFGFPAQRANKHKKTPSHPARSAGAGGGNPFVWLSNRAVDSGSHPF